MKPQKTPIIKLLLNGFALILVFFNLLGCQGISTTTAELNKQGNEPFYGAKFEPEAGRAIHGWGQITHGWNTNHPGAIGDKQDYYDYLATVGDHAPAIVSFYIHPQRKDGQQQLDGFIERYKKFAEEDSWQMAQIAYDFDPEMTLSGQGDKQLEQFFSAVSAIGKPVLMRIGWEFNNRGHFDPKGYREGYRYIVDKMRAMNVTNVATLWHASVPDLNELSGMPILEPHDYMDYYPGDDYVDWWSISQFSIESFRSPGSIEFYNNAAARKKPVFIGESSPWFTVGRSMKFRDPESFDESIAWFDAYFTLFHEFPQIKGMNIIIVDWQRWNWIWPQLTGGFNNTRLDLWLSLPQRFQQWLNDPKFIHANEAKVLFN
ncbi:hypothetical protein RI844_12265 [Thalassotalea fonticola]|uniref:GH26 domain-containing protein n=1 Tax=Thalassotalea fonticola TaxID=3065649 RepID=A0ABZ0GKV3_9GAMM|nr:hypothetical protein RI844_12265 [Colwelliaceae bacterium S1-1]